METLPLRLPPESDLRQTLEAMLRERQCRAAFVLAGVGSLREARLRLGGQEGPVTMRGDLEILTLSGALSLDGAHLHMSLADSAGQVTGGHVAQGCVVRTTAEVLVALLPEWSFARELDPATGYPELVVRPAS